MLMLEIVQGHYLQPANARQPFSLIGIDTNGCGVLRIKLVQLHQQGATFFAEGRVASAGWVPEVGAGRVMARLVGEYSLQYQDFLAQWVLMPLEGRTGFVANYAGGMAPFGLFPCQRLALHTRRRAGLPFLFAGMNNHSLGEIHIQHEKPRISAI